MGGGGGGGGDGGAGQREAERQARIRAATDEINNIFNNKYRQNVTVYRDGSGNQITKEQYNALMDDYANGTGAYAGVSTSDEFGNTILSRVGNLKSPTEAVESIWVDGDPSNSREKLYNDQKTAVYNLNKAEVDRQAKEAERKTRFGLARVGLLGGSEDVDAAAENDRRTNEGLLRAGGIADQAAADFRAADERTRSNLISMAQSGIDTGTAAQMALGGLKANADSMAEARAGATVGGLFNDLSQAYLMNQVLAGKNSGANAGYGQQWYGVSNPRQTSQGTVQN